MFLGGCKGLAQTKEISFRVQDGHIQWKYGGDNTWTNIISADELKKKGQDGVPGKDGADEKDGIDGIDGIAPQIGANGNLVIGDFETGIYAGKVNTGVSQSGEFEFALNTDGASFYHCDYKGKDCLVIVPEQYRGYSNTSIGWKAFYNHTASEKVVIPRTVESMYSSAFMGAKNQKSN